MRASPLWKNGDLLREINDRITLTHSGAYADATYIFTYWNGASPATQHMYIDDLVITSDTPASRDTFGNPVFGMGIAAVRPSPPSDVSTQE